MEHLTLSSPVTCLTGIKAVRAAQLEKLSIRTLYDLIAYFPRTYEDRTHKADIGSLEPGKDADIAIFDGHPFSSLSACRMTIIDGKIVHNTL